MTKLKTAFFLLISILILQGCATAVITGAATGVAIAHDRRTAGTVIDDQAIEYKAYAALRQNKEIQDQSHINVTSYNGIVLLTGETLNEELKRKAADEIKKINKVRHIYNELIIAAPSSLPSRSNDAWITSKIKAKLTADLDVDPFYVKVVTEHSVVYLMGIVSHAEADKAVSIVSKSAGVQRVVKVFEYMN